MHQLEFVSELWKTTESSICAYWNLEEPSSFSQEVSSKASSTVSFESLSVLTAESHAESHFQPFLYLYVVPGINKCNIFQSRKTMCSYSLFEN